MGFEFDDQNWPAVTARWSGTVTDRDLDGALARIDEYLERGQRFGLLIDSRGGGGFSPEQRHRLLAHMKLRSQLTARLLVQAVVIDNLIQRTLYYGVRMLFPTPFPSRAFGELEAAQTWLESEIAVPAGGHR
jgi:hypothetical protein